MHVSKESTLYHRPDRHQRGSIYFSEFRGMTEDAYYMLQNGAMYLPLFQEGEYYRLFTSIFLHFGFSHLVNNMLMLGVMGWQLELTIGKIILINGGLITPKQHGFTSK